MNTTPFLCRFTAILAVLVGFCASLFGQTTYGINPSFDAPYSRAIVWADGMERARSLDPSGTRLFDDVEVPAGTWTVTWTGSGVAHLVGQVREASRAPGRATYAIDRNARPLSVRWTGHVEDLHVWLPGVEGRQFWPPFVQLLRALDPVTLRTLDWSLPNVHPNGRDGRVVAPELQVALVNRVGCGLHYTIPVGLTDAQLGTLFRVLAGVVGEVTLEVGNENWNSGLWSWNWFDPQPGRVVDAVAREIDRVFAIAERELPRARHYVGGQLSNPWFLRTVMDLLAPSTRVDACGAAAYVGPRATPATADQCVDACLARVPEIRGNVREHLAIAVAHGCAFELYEAGQSFRNGGGVVAAAQRLPGMGDVYRQLDAMLRAEGVQRVIWYSLMTSQDLGNVAPFGVFQAMGGPLLPKGQAVLELMRQ